MSLCLCVSFESESEREKERVERWSKGTSKGPVRSFVFIAAAFRGSSLGFESLVESQVFLTLFPSSFFFPLS